MIDLDLCAKQCKLFSDMRKENGGVCSDVLKHCATELVESVQARGYYNSAKAKAMTKDDEVVSSLKLNYGKELGDALVCLLVAMAEEGINPEMILKMTMEKNRKRAEGKGDKK